jgi:hypothetical protein
MRVAKVTPRKLGWSAGSTSENSGGKRTVRRLEAAALVGAWGLQIRKVLCQKRAGLSRRGSCEAFVGGREKETVTAKMTRSGGTLTWINYLCLPRPKIDHSPPKLGFYTFAP